MQGLGYLLKGAALAASASVDSLLQERVLENSAAFHPGVLLEELPSLLLLQVGITMIFLLLSYWAI